MTLHSECSSLIQFNSANGLRTNQMTKTKNVLGIKEETGSVIQNEDERVEWCFVC